MENKRHSTINAVHGQQKEQNCAKSHVPKKQKQFFFFEFHGFRFKSAIPRIPRLFRDRGKSLALYSPPVKSCLPVFAVITGALERSKLRFPTSFWIRILLPVKKTAGATSICEIRIPSLVVITFRRCKTVQPKRSQRHMSPLRYR